MFLKSTGASHASRNRTEIASKVDVLIRNLNDKCSSSENSWAVSKLCRCLVYSSTSLNLCLLQQRDTLDSLSNLLRAADNAINYYFDTFIKLQADVDLAVFQFQVLPSLFENILIFDSISVEESTGDSETKISSTVKIPAQFSLWARNFLCNIADEVNRVCGHTASSVVIHNIWVKLITSLIGVYEHRVSQLDGLTITASLKQTIALQCYFDENCYDSHSIKLLNIVVTNKTNFGYTDSDITNIIDKFWNALIKSEELIGMLTALNSINAADEDALRRFEIFEKLFRLIFKCQLNKAKGGIFSEFFRQVSFQIIIKLRKFDAPTQLIVRQKLLDCQKHLSINIQIPVTFDLIDDIIGFMTETVKQQQIKTATDVSLLKETHSRISDLCYSPIQHRHYFIIDRIPQFVIILKDLLQSICWFKCNRVRGQQLSDDEVTTLAELSHKMENIIKVFVKHAKEVKRIAPYFLLFIINLMISKENVSTLYSMVKTHIDYICYDLISVCDHRVEGFIMRNCNEASKQQYETMVKEYRKYHKFKGKV